MLYFTSDLHLGHRAILDFQDRPFQDIEEMNRTLINNINQTVNRTDTLYILGDFSYRIAKEEAEDLLKKIKCKKVLIRGNHDKKYDESLFEGVYDYLSLKDNHKRYIMMHYPLRSWNRMAYGSIQLHGHIHGTMKYNLENREKGIYQYDVGVDANDYFPVSRTQIEAFFEGVPLQYRHHHFYEEEEDTLEE